MLGTNNPQSWSLSLIIPLFNVFNFVVVDSNVKFSNLRKAFADYLKGNNPSNKEKGILTADRVHLNPKGNLLVAAEMWKIIQNSIN